MKARILIIVDRKRTLGNWFRFQKMRGVTTLGWKIGIFRYEIRFYNEGFNNSNFSSDFNRICSIN